MDTFSPLIKAWKQKGITKTNKMLKKKLKVALHLVHSNSFCNKKSLHVCKLDHRWRTTLIQKKQARLAKNGVSQEYIGPPILEKIQMYILTRAEILYWTFISPLGPSIKDVSSNFSFLTPPTYPCLLFLLNSPI